MTQAEEDKFVIDYFHKRCEKGELAFYSVIMERQAEVIRNVLASHSYVSAFSPVVNGWVQISAILIYSN